MAHRKVPAIRSDRVALRGSLLPGLGGWKSPTPFPTHPTLGWEIRPQQPQRERETHSALSESHFKHVQIPKETWIKPQRLITAQGSLDARALSASKRNI